MYTKSATLYTFLNQVGVGKNVRRKDDRITSLLLSVKDSSNTQESQNQNVCSTQTLSSQKTLPPYKFYIFLYKKNIYLNIKIIIFMIITKIVKLYSLCWILNCIVKIGIKDNYLKSNKVLTINIKK